MYNYTNPRARKAQQEARRHADDADRVTRHGNYALDAIQRLHGHEIPIALEDFSSVVLATDLTRGGYSRKEAAAHEVGHCVALEWIGRLMGLATIWGPHGGARGWGGTTLCNEPTADHWSVPINCLRQAVVCVAGPVTGDTHGGGKAERHIGELMGARVYAEHGAMLMGSPEEAWAEVVRMAVALTSVYRRLISLLTEELYRRKHIDRSEPAVRKLLADITPRELIKVHFTTKEETVVREVLRLTPRVDDIIQRGKERALRLEVGR